MIFILLFHTYLCNCLVLYCVTICILNRMTTRIYRRLSYDVPKPIDYINLLLHPTFLDKSELLIELLNDNCKQWLITSPPGFGKTTNMEMLQFFVEINIDRHTVNGPIYNNTTKLNFIKKESLVICTNNDIIRDHFGQYAVIHLSMKNIYGYTMDEVMDNYVKKLRQLFIYHDYLANDNYNNNLTDDDREEINRYLLNDNRFEPLTQMDIELGIPILIKILGKYHTGKNVYILIDDYDEPIIQYICDTYNTIDEQSYLQFFTNIYENILLTESKKFSVRTLFTGIFRIDFELLEALIYNNELKTYIFPTKNRLSIYYGFTPDDIDFFYNEFYAINELEKRNFIKTYGIGLLDATLIYSPHITMEYLYKRKFDNFYIVNNIFDFFTTIIANCTIRNVIETLLTLGVIEFRLPKRYDINYLIKLRKMYMNQSINNYYDKITDPTLFIYCLYSYGLLDSESADYPPLPTTNMIYLHLNNKFIHSDLRNLIHDYYGDQLDEQLEQCADLLTKVIDCPRDSNLCNEFLKIYQSTLITYSTRYPLANFFSISCIIDIISKCSFTCLKPIMPPSDIEQHFILLHSHREFYEPRELLTAIVINATFDTEIKMLISTVDNARCTVYIGINGTRYCKCDMGILVRNDINGKSYYTYPVEVYSTADY